MGEHQPLEVAISDAVRRVVQDVLDVQAKDLHTAQVVAAIVSKPILSSPNDLMILASCSRTTAFDLMQQPGFPKTSKHGRRQIARTSAVLDSLRRWSPPMADREVLAQMGDVMRLGFIAPELLGSDCVPLTLMAREAFERLGFEARVVAGGRTVRFGPMPHMFLVNVPEEWGGEAGYGWPWHAWLIIGREHCLDLQCGWLGLGFRITHEDKQRGLSTVDADHRPFPDVMGFDPKEHLTVRDLHRAAAGTASKIAHRRDRDATDELRRTEPEVRRKFSMFDLSVEMMVKNARGVLEDAA